MAAPLPEQQAQLKRLDEELAAATAAYAKLQPDVARAQREWERSLDTSDAGGMGADARTGAHYSFDSDLVASGCGAAGGEEHASRPPHSVAT